MVTLPSPILVCCGVIFGLLAVDLHFDLPFMLALAGSADLSAAVTSADIQNAAFYYTRIETISANNVFISAPLLLTSAVLIVTLGLQLLKYLLIEDFFAFVPLGVLGFQFLEHVLPARHALLSLDDQPEMQKQQLMAIACAHFYIFLCLLAVAVLQLGAQSSILERRRLADERKRAQASDSKPKSL